MSNWRTMAVATMAMCVTFAGSLFTAGPTFKADYRFTGTALGGFTAIGDADWKVENGEIVGRPKTATGGWLLLESKELQNLQVYASMKCVEGCRAGFLMRAEKTPDGGMKGVLMSVTENDLVPYTVKIDANGKEVSREPFPYRSRPEEDAEPVDVAVRAARTLRPAPLSEPLPRLPPTRAGASSTPARRRRCRPSSPRSIRRSRASRARPAGAYMPGDYNAIEVLVTDNSVQPKFNGGSLGRGGAGGSRSIPDAERDGYGQIGFYVGGTGEVRIKDFMYKDILNHVWAPEVTGKNFKEIRVDPHYYSWSAAVADFNRDGTSGRRRRARSTTSAPTTRSASRSTRRCRSTRRLSGRSRRWSTSRSTSPATAGPTCCR